MTPRDPDLELPPERLEQIRAYTAGCYQYHPGNRFVACDYSCAAEHAQAAADLLAHVDVLAAERERLLARLEALWLEWAGADSYSRGCAVQLSRALDEAATVHSGLSGSPAPAETSPALPGDGSCARCGGPALGALQARVDVCKDCEAQLARDHALERAQDAVDAWNERHPPGTPVTYRPWLDQPERHYGHTAGPAFLVSGTPVVSANFPDRHRAACSLGHLSLAPEDGEGAPWSRTAEATTDG